MRAHRIQKVDRSDLEKWRSLVTTRGNDVDFWKRKAGQWFSKASENRNEANHYHRETRRLRREAARAWEFADELSARLTAVETELATTKANSRRHF